MKINLAMAKTLTDFPLCPAVLAILIKVFIILAIAVIGGVLVK